MDGKPTGIAYVRFLPKGIGTNNIEYISIPRKGHREYDSIRVQLTQVPTALYPLLEQHGPFSPAQKAPDPLTRHLSSRGGIIEEYVCERRLEKNVIKLLSPLRLYLSFVGYALSQKLEELRTNQTSNSDIIN